jgi:hypothetical protein
MKFSHIRQFLFELLEFPVWHTEFSIKHFHEIFTGGDQRAAGAVRFRSFLSLDFFHLSLNLVDHMGSPLHSRHPQRYRYYH